MGFFDWLFQRNDGEEWLGEEEARRAAADKENIRSQARLSGRSLIVPKGLPTFRGRAGGLSLRTNNVPEPEDVRIRLRNAFTPSQPVAALHMFAGRRVLLEGIIRAVEDQQLHFVLYGDRGIGKTSTLRVVSQIASDAGYLVCYVSCGETSNFQETFRSVGAKIPLLFHRDFAPSDEEAEQGGTFADLLPKEGFSLSLLSEVLANITGTRVIVMLDEFDRIASDDFRRSIAELIKNLSDRSTPLQLIIAGVAVNLTDLISYIPSIRRNILGMAVPNMDSDEVREMLDIAELQSGLKFDAHAHRAIVLSSLGLPYLVGLIGQHAGIEATTRDVTVVQPGDVDRAVKAAVEEIGQRLSPATGYAIELCLANQQATEYLTRLAYEALRAGGLISAEQVSHENSSAWPSDVAEGISQLLEPFDDDPLSRWKFREDGASTLIWLSSIVVGRES